GTRALYSADRAFSRSRGAYDCRGSTGTPAPRPRSSTGARAARGARTGRLPAGLADSLPYGAYCGTREDTARPRTVSARQTDHPGECAGVVRASRESRDLESVERAAGRLRRRAVAANTRRGAAGAGRAGVSAQAARAANL